MNMRENARLTPLRRKEMPATLLKAVFPKPMRRRQIAVLEIADIVALIEAK